MTLFVVDRERCLRDGICMDECPRYLIEMREADAYPTPVEGAEERCMNCGHCVAVCPVEALALKTTTPEQCGDVRLDLLPSAAQVEQFLQTRRSTRTFQERPVARELLARLIGLARYAPSASNRQPVEWLVIYDGEEVRRLAKMSRDWLREQSLPPDSACTIAMASERDLDIVCRGAPHLVIAHTPQAQWADGVIALTHLELAVYALGLGACWSRYFSMALNGLPGLREVLGLPDGHVCCGTLLVGYPKYEYPRVPPRNAARITWR
jgi:nitroreductase/NAD-dependent dihydropyrimidine dehydrogenase PreA subunit